MRPLDREALRQHYVKAVPFPFVKIENLLEPAFAAELAAAYPSFEDATGQGRAFKSVNERKKVQITDAKLFPAQVARLNAALASPEFLADLSYVTGIPDLLADAELTGGGMHITGRAVGSTCTSISTTWRAASCTAALTFCFISTPFGRKNGAATFSSGTRDVKSCRQAFEPVLNRCVIFETSEISFHGVTPVTDAAPYPRISFATYYYTREPPPNWDGTVHSTIFKARPEERLRGYVLMPAEVLQRQLMEGVRRVKRGVKRLVNMVR